MERPTASRFFLRLADLWLIGALACGSFIAVLRVGLLPTNPATGVAVIYAPWTTADQAMARSISAGARFVRFGGLPFIAVVLPDRSDYVDRVLADSALLAVDPQAVAACLPKSFLGKERVL
jgi:hypothetical protein